MRNTIIYNLNDFNCDCLSMVNDGSNSLAIEARKSDFSTPQIFITLSDSSTVTEALTDNNGIITYTIPPSYYTVSGSIIVKIIDGSYSSPEITITGAENSNGNDLTLKMESDTSFICSVANPTPSGGDFSDEWKSTINANAAARHSHSNKGALDVIETALTNTEIEALLQD